MSSDLFAAFAAPPKEDIDPQRKGSDQNRPQHQQQQQQFSFFDNLNAPPTSHQTHLSNLTSQPGLFPSNNVASDDFDDFGDFEDADPTVSTTQTRSKDSRLNDDLQQLWDFDTSTSKPQSGQKSNQNWDLGSLSFHSSQPKPVPHQLHSSSSALTSELSRPQQVKLDQIAPDPNVLFDADADNDDFGDFEDAEEKEVRPEPKVDNRVQIPLAKVQSQVQNQSTQPASFSLLDLDDALPFEEPAKQEPAAMKNEVTSPVVPTRNQSAVSSFAIRGTAVKDSGTQPKKQPKSQEQNKKPPATAQESDDWQDFEDWEPTEPSAEKKSNQLEDTSTPRFLNAIPQSSFSEPSGNELPPTNVPPPAVLLSMFPPIFADAQKKFFKPLATQSQTARNQVLSHKKARDFLQGHILIATVAGRVIAGRKLRWKRDTLLSQGMKIGPASSRATTGMKLTGIDRGETAKEDREAVDVVRVWREQLGRVRSAVAGANSAAPQAIGGIPELQETIAVRTAAESDGGIRAPRPCALCGLKREERVHKIDLVVEDSFGEWWIDQMSMHRACRNFWIAHKEALPQR